MSLVTCQNYKVVHYFLSKNKHVQVENNMINSKIFNKKLVKEYTFIIKNLSIKNYDFEGVNMRKIVQINFNLQKNIFFPQENLFKKYFHNLLRYIIFYQRTKTQRQEAKPILVRSEAISIFLNTNSNFVK